MKYDVSSGTVTRTICLCLALINQVSAILGKGKIEIADDSIYQLVSLVFTVVTTVIAWWKNNSFTQAAIIADKVLKDEKALKKEGE